MRRRALLFVVLLPLLCLARGASADDDLRQLKRRLAAAGKQTRTLAASFTQRKRLKLFRTEVTSRGRLYFKAPDHLRWETLPPDASTLVVVGDRAELRLPGERVRAIDLRRDRAMATLVEQLLVWIGARPADKLTEWYRVEQRRDGQAHELTLWPRAAAVKKRVGRVEVRFGADMLLQRIDLFHPDGDSTRITFDKVTRNKPLPADVF